MGQALRTIGGLMASVMGWLTAVGLAAAADQLAALHAAVADHGRRHPDTPITFPTMVAAGVDFTDQAGGTTFTTAIGQRRARRRADPTGGLPPAGPPQLGVYRLESEELIGQARRLHAATYVTHGHHTDDSIDADGFLIAPIDPPPGHRRPIQVPGCPRRRRPREQLHPHDPPRRRRPEDPAHPGQTDLPPTNQTTVPARSILFEASGLAKSRCSRDPAVTTRLLLAVFSEARRCGDDYGVMGLVATTANLLIAVYGRQAICPLDSIVGTIAVTGTGIRPGGITLIPCYAQSTTFVTDCLHYCRAKPDHELSRINQPLIEHRAAVFAQPPPPLNRTVVIATSIQSGWAALPSLV
jgi:hypothetical protein